jgi:predicted GTPase
VDSTNLVFTLGAHLIYVLIVGTQTLIRTNRQETELEKSRMGVLRSQIQPHFLFNSLTAIAQLCDKDPKMAKQAAITFSDYYRGNLRAIDRADVCLLVIDGSIGMTDQDQRVAGYARERGCAMIILLNKWDLVDGPERKADIRERIEDRMMFVNYAPVIAIIATTGKNTHRIWDAIDNAYANFSKEISTSKLNVWLAEIREFGFAPNKGKRSLKLKYVTQTGSKPPVFTFFANHPDLFDDNFERYLSNRLRKAFDFTGTPIEIKVKKKSD